MNWLRLIVLVLLGVANIGIAGAVSARDFKKLNNIAFAFFSLSIGAWIIGIAGFSYTSDRNLAFAWAQLYYLAPLLIALFGMLFVLSFPFSDRIRNPIMYPLLAGFIALAAPLVAHRSFLMRDLTYHSWGKEIILNHTPYLLYSSFVVFFFAVILLMMHLKSKRLHGLYALQARLFFQGLSITAMFGLLFNLILPLLGNYRLIELGPLFTSISVSVVGYAIIRHRMFDIRLVVARTLGYASSLVVIASLYGFIVFGIAHFIFGLQFSIGTQILFSGATGVSALLFSRIKKTFDRATNRLFYRDAYDPQDLFDNLNKLLVSTLDLDKLMHQVTDLLCEQLKAEFCLLSLKETVGYPQRVFGGKTQGVPFKEIMTLRRLVTSIHRTVIVVDELEGDRHSELKRVMDRNGIAAIVRLTPTTTHRSEGLGFLLLGARKSGNPYSTYDIRALDTIANELIIAIQNALHFEEIQNFNATLQEKIVQATKELRRSNEKLKALDETKDDFISMASHQLRTPLTSVKGYLSLVLDGDAGSIKPTQRELLGQAFASSQRMVYLISDLLNVSRLRTGKFIINPEPVNLAEVIVDELAQLKETAATRSLQLQYDKPAHFPVLMLDETKTRQVIMNFVDNAIYYTPAGGHISVHLEDKPTTIELRVVDDGIGVPKAEQRHLFTKFYRAGNARKARPDGTGLGLFMAKKVIAAQGGAIVFDSEEGKGSTFGFTFSKASLTPPPTPSISVD